jgi:dimethylsulfone monooxygenase
LDRAVEVAKVKLGIFGINGKGTANTRVPNFRRPTWEANLRAARLADDAGLEAIVPYARWKGHEIGKLDHPSGIVLDPLTGLLLCRETPIVGL